MIPSYRDLKDEGYLGVDFYLTKSCNKSCHYCTAWTLEMRNLEIDMEFLSKTLKWMSPYKARVNFLGGEPGLTKNLDEAIAEVKKYPNLKPCVLSNSFVRKRYAWILEDPEVYYVEHLVLDFEEDKIKKLGNFDFFGPNEMNNYNLIIKTPGYYEYRDKFIIPNIDHNNTILKEYNSRSPTFDVQEQAPEFERRMCAAFPMVPVIDFELQKIRHCSKKVINGSRTFDVTQENIDKMFNFELFEYEEYCKKCTEVIGIRPQEQILRILEAGVV